MLRSRTALGGMVTAPHHLAAEAGAAVLREGGHAVEAAVAALSTVAVVYPHMNTLGGDGFWLIAEPGRAPVAIDASGPAARLATLERYRARDLDAIPARGPDAALTVAGAVGGWQAALNATHHWGAPLPLARLLEDAIRHAERGVPITPGGAALTAAKRDELQPVAGFAETFLPDGLHAGAVLHQPTLARTLRRLAGAGLDDFYRGELARDVAVGLEAVGSPLRLADFEAFHAEHVEPLALRLGDAEIFDLPPPSQGVASLMILALFERLGVAEADGVDHIHGLVEATKRAFAKRDAELGDPASMRADVRDWLDPGSLDAEAARIDMGTAAPWPAAPDGGDTVWVGAADHDGRVVSVLQSAYWEYGSGVVVPGTGVVWQNRGAAFALDDGPNGLRPGRRPRHTLNPALARFDDGRTLVWGTMGGDGQPQTQAAVFTRFARFGQDLQAAITAPRWLLGRTWGERSTTLKLERRIEAHLCDELRIAGHPLELVDDFDDRMGHAGAICVHPLGVLEGAADPRADGTVATL
ncbi:MAG: gamma-glutamyltransferase [Alphaproteobacteria bacterium]|jgi:gamma-glutamyltranspeptidase/glutathione hydrolase|nr:gamma-glutamyltransferase [Alphaproteobacteria bacterium]